MKSLCTILLLLLLSSKVTAGNFYIAPQFAYCKSASIQLLEKTYEPEIFHLFSKSSEFIFLRTGATLSYEQKWFSYSTGLLYSRILEDYDLYDYLGDLNIFQLPLNCNLHIGKKLYSYLSVGAYLNYLYIKKEDSEFRIPDFQVGIIGGIGMGYRFSSLLAIDICYRAENNFTPLYSEWLSTGGPWRNGYWGGKYVHFRTLNLSLKFALGRKKDECIR